MPATRPQYLSPLSFRRFSFAAIGVLILASFGSFAAPSVSASNNPVPYIDLVAPVSANPGATGVTLTVLGTGFVGTSVVKWNSISLTTTFVNSKKLTASVPDSFVAAVGLGAITVVSPTPGGGTSNVFYFPVAASEGSTRFPSSPSSSVSVGGMPQGITAADLNNDGKIDLAVANNADGTVSILLGNGNGTFTTKSTPAAGVGANWIAVGDFNEDGKPDLAVANSGVVGAGGVRILIGNGDGTYTAGASLTTGSNPFAITTADFNGDGHLDLAVSNASDGTITVFLGNGNGTFGAGRTITVGTLPQQIVPGDFNEDGILDLAVTNETDGTVSILLGNGDGTFQGQSTFSTGGSGTPIGLITADFNKDNHLDLAAVNASDVAILLGNGSGSFTLNSNPTTGSGDLIAGVVGDYNGDGNLDLVLSDRTAGEAFLFLGAGNGTFGSATTFTTASGAFGVATADFNGDGALDLAVANGNANNVSIFLQTLPVSLAPSSIAFGNQVVGVASSPSTVTLTNSSGSTLTIVRIIFTGTDSADFSSGGTCSTASPVLNGATCTITVTFTPGATGARVATLSVTDTASNSPQTLALSGTGIVLAPTISKAFGAASIPLNGSTTLTFTITNPAGNTSALTGVGFVDTLPVGLVISSPNGLTGTCGSGTVTATAGASSLNLSGGTLAANASCTFGVNVTGVTVGAQANTTGAVSSNESGAGATSNTATVTVAGPPTISKVFGAASIPLHGTTTLSFTITNPNTGTALSGVGFGDTFPAGLQVSSPSIITGSCPSGSIFASAGSGSVIMSGATLAANASCTFGVNVTGTAAGVLNNVTGGAGSTQGGAGTGASASVTVIGPPSIAKAFGAASIALNASTSLTFTITNPAANTVGLTGVAFTDTLPAGMVVATPNGAANTCGGVVTAVAGSGSVSISGVSIAVNSACTLAINVTGTTSGSLTNTSGAVSSTNGGTGNTASANLAVVTPATVTKTFGAASVALGGSTSLTFVVGNPDASTAQTGVAFTDSLPAGLVVATPNGLAGTCGGGTITASAGSGSVSLAGATLAPSAGCTFSVNVTGATVGVKNNSVTVSSTTAGAGNTSNASVTVAAPPTIAKSFGAATIPLNGGTSLTINISNTNASLSLTGAAFSDALPAGLVVATPNGLANTCGGTATAVAGAGSVSLTSGTLAASASCSFAVNITGIAAGAQNNTTGAVTSTQGGTGGTASASVAVVAPPSIAKVFGAASIGLSASTSLTFTITNPGANTVGLTGVAFTDALPTGILVATPNGVANTCGGVVTAVAGSGSVSISAGAIATNSNCTLTVNVTGTVSGSYTNVTGAVSSTNGGNGNTASANISVASPPAITKTFGAASVALNGSTSLTFVVNNPNSSSTLTGVAFTDSLPAGLVVATPNGLAGTCGGGTITASAGSGSVSLASATLAASASCTFSVNVTGTAGGVKNNSVTVTSATAGAGNTSNASVTVLGPPTIAKVFGAATIALNSSTSLTINLSNPNASASLTGIAFTDTLPAGLVVTTPNGLTNSCGGTATGVAGSASVSLSGGTLAASASCSLTVNVTGIAAGAQNNTTGAVTSTQGGTGGTASASVAVVAAPSIAKVFGAASISLSASTSLTFTITNPVANTVGLTGVVFTDALPAGIVVATPNGLANSCGGVVTAAAGSGSVSLTAATVAASSSCVVSVNVTATALGPVTNTTGTISSTNGGTGNAATASLTVGTAAAITSANGGTFTVGVAGSFTITTTGSPTPSITETGTLPSGLTFVDNGNGTATLSGTPLASGTAGVYTITVTAHNGVGADSVQTFTITIGKGTPTLTWATPAAISFGTALSGTQLDAIASVAGSFVYAPAAGTVLGAGSQTLSVTFTPTDASDFTTATASVTLIVNKGLPVITWAMPAAISFGTALSATQLDASTTVAGTFMYSPATGTILGAGTQNLSVTFTPTDGADDSTATKQVSLVVNPAGTTNGLFSSASTANVGVSVTFTATVLSSAGTPSGNVTFLDGGATLGIVPLAAGSTAFTTSTLTVGTHTIGATYSGSANFAASNAPSITETIVAPQFTLSVSAPTSVVQAGQTATIPLTVTPVGGFSGPIQFSVTGLPPKATAMFSPPVLTLGANPAIETLTIVTVAPSNTVPGVAAVAAPSRRILAGILWFPVAGLLLTGVGFARRRNGKGAAWIVLLALFAGAGILAGCAGEPRFKFPGTPDGHYTVTVTATAVNSPGTPPQSTMVTLIVK